MHPSNLRFSEKIAQVKETHERKCLDYGSDADPFNNVRASQDFGIPPWIGAMVRLNDKVTRLKSLAQNGRLHNETAADSFLDIAVYALIAWCLYEEAEIEPVGNVQTPQPSFWALEEEIIERERKASETLAKLYADLDKVAAQKAHDPVTPPYVPPHLPADTETYHVY